MGKWACGHVVPDFVFVNICESLHVCAFVAAQSECKSMSVSACACDVFLTQALVCDGMWTIWPAILFLHCMCEYCRLLVSLCASKFAHAAHGFVQPFGGRILQDCSRMKYITSRYRDTGNSCC